MAAIDELLDNFMSYVLYDIDILAQLQKIYKTRLQQLEDAKQEEIHLTQFTNIDYDMLEECGVSKRQYD